MKAFLAVFLLAATAAAPALSQTRSVPGGLALPADACARLGAERTAADAAPLMQRLDRLPPAVLQNAVIRSVGGCWMIEVRERGGTRYVPSPPRFQGLTPVGGPSRR